MRVVLPIVVLTGLLAAPGLGLAAPEGGAGAAPAPTGAAPAPAASPAPAEAPPREAAPGAPAETPPAAGGSAPAAAEAPARPAEVISSKAPKKLSLSHKKQFGVEIGVGAGYSFMVTYRDTTWCGQLDGADNASFCSGMHPVHMDFGLSYGIIHQLDVIAEFRVGLMDDPTFNRPLMLMTGLRIWVDAEQAFKIGVGFQLVIDLTKQNSSEQRMYGPPVKGESLDLGGRIFAQFQYDFLRHLGLYGKIDASATARRWLQVNVGGQIGLQTRFP